MGPDGTVLASWERSTHGASGIHSLEVAFRQPGKGFRPVTLPDAAPSVGAESAFTPDGTAIIVWIGARGLEAAGRPPGGSFGAPQVLSTNAVAMSRVVVDRSGVATVAWSDGAGIFVSSWLTGRFIGPERVATLPPADSTYGSRPFTGPAVGVGPGRRMIMAWAEPAGIALDLPNVVKAVVRLPGGAFGPARTVATRSPELSVSSLAIALNPRGDADLLFEDEGTELHGPVSGVGAVHVSSGGAFGPSRTLDSTAREPSLAVNGAGRIEAMWGDASDTTEGLRFDRVTVAAAGPGGWFSRSRAVASKAGDPTMAAAGDGSILAAWTRIGGSGDESRPEGVRAAWQSASGGQFCAQTVASYSADLAAVQETGAAGDARGDGVLVFVAGRRVRAVLGQADHHGLHLRFAIRGHRAGRSSATVRVRLSEAARIRLHLARRIGARYHRIGAIARAEPAGRSVLTLPTRLGHRALKAGRYRARATATDCDGHTYSVPRTIRFAVR